MDVIDDEELLIQILDLIGYKLQMLDDQGIQERVLYHQKYDNFEAANQVRDDSKNLADMIRRFSEVEGTKLGIRFGSVRQHNTDGSTNRHSFADAHIMLGGLTLTATAALIRNPTISEEEHQRLVKKAAERVEKQRKNAIVQRAVAAIQQPRVLEVMKLMRIPQPTTTELGHIVDLVQDACNGNIDSYTSAKQLRRFHHSINDPTVFGLEARHAVAKSAPPAEPMSLEEVRAFAHKVGRAWLKEFENEK
ncbi:MAG: hypothetical protein R3E57_08095 [Porticoccaceae bacterium]